MHIVVCAGDVACDLGKTHDYIINTLQNKANVCLVCIESIKKTEPVSIELHCVSEKWPIISFPIT